MHFENSQLVDYSCFQMFGDPFGGFVTTQVDAVGDFTVGEAADGERPPMSGLEVTTFTPLSTRDGCQMQPPGSSTRQVTFTPA